MNDVRYVIVAGALWLGYTAVWLATWTGEPRARKWQVDELPHMDVRGASARVDGAAWDLRFSGPGRPHAFPHRLGARQRRRDGWVELLAARVLRLPMLATYADERCTVNAPWRMPFMRVALAPERSRVGPSYHDPDGAALFCYHTERARPTGPGLEAVDVAYESASRRPREGWTISI